MIVVVGIALVTLALSLAQVQVAILRPILATLMVCAVPGYALTEALFLGRQAPTLERVLWSLGLSLAVTGLGSFALYVSPWGIRELPWAVLLSGVTVAASALAVVRRRRNPGVEAPPVRLQMNLRAGLLFAVALLVTALAVREARTAALEQPSVGFTQLWLLPVEQAARPTVRLGIRCMEHEATGYRLRLSVDGQIAQEWGEIALEPNGLWEQTFELPPAQAGAKRLEALLYRLDAPQQVYRRGVVWFGTGG